MQPCHPHLMSVAFAHGLSYDAAKSAVEAVMAKAEKERMKVDAHGSPRAWLVVCLVAHIQQLQRPALWKRIKKALQSLADYFRS
jgi:DNA-directed RNA polymerase specialized sigma24 family protein